MSNTKIYSWHKACKPPVAPHIANRVGHGVLLYTNKIPTPILSLFILEIKYQYQFLPLKNTNKIPIPILHLFKAIPCYSNSTPILKFLTILKQLLLGMLVQSCDNLQSTSILLHWWQVAFRFMVRFFILSCCFLFWSKGS